MKSISLLETQDDVTRVVLPHIENVVEGLIQATSKGLFDIVTIGLNFDVLIVYFELSELKGFSISRFLNSGFRGSLLIKVLGSEKDRERLLEFIINTSLEKNRHLRDRIHSLSQDCISDSRLFIQSSYDRNRMLVSLLKDFYGHQCTICKEFILTDNLPYTEAHHMIPLSEGGIYGAKNIAIICPKPC